ncbi:MAG TPA: hypothetical protein VM075_11060 [Anaerolineae bacterium]|nr:hypothetical protein [Anaerolineae bacterium]
MKNAIAAIIIAAALLTGCATPVPGPTETPTHAVVPPTATPTLPSETPTTTATHTPTATPAATPTFEPTSTPTSIPTYNLSGTVFFDYNGNGLRDQGEPAIEGAPIRVAGLSTTSEPDGTYSVAGVPAGTQQVYVESPTQEPATAFRYINRFLGWVDIPAYEMNGVSVPAQHLADTEVDAIDRPLSVVLTNDERLDMALMLGFLTLPFLESDVPNPVIWNYFDVNNDQIICEGRQWSADGSASNYDGTYHTLGGGDPDSPEAGAQDGHTGLDCSVPLNTYVVHAGPRSQVFSLLIKEDGEKMVHTMFQDPSGPQMFKNTYGHLNAQIVELDTIVYRGQIVGLSGNSGSSPYLQLHFDLSRTTPGRCIEYLDPFRTTIPYSTLDNFAGSLASYWTVDNDPQFP